MNTYIKHFFRSWKQHATLQITSLSILAATFTVVASFYLVQKNFESVLSTWGEEVEFNVFFIEGTSLENIQKVKHQISKSKVFSKTVVIPKDEAKEIFKKKMGHMIPGLDLESEIENPFPDGITASVAQNAMSGKKLVDYLSRFAENLKLNDSVEEVLYGQSWVKNYASMVSTISNVMLLIVVTLMSGSFFVVGNLIRNSINQRKEEIEIRELFGATKMMIGAPYIFEGMLLGMISSGFSLLILSLIYHWQGEIVQKGLSFWTLNHSLSFMSVGEMIVFVLVCSLIGALGALISVFSLSSGWLAAKANECWD